MQLGGLSPTPHIHVTHVNGVHWVCRLEVDCQECWFEVLLVRTDTVGHVAGGVSAIMYTLLKDVFYTNTGLNVANPGLLLDMHSGGSMRVNITLGAFVADEAALHSVFCCKGASGLKPCFLCQNIFHRDLSRDIVHSDTSGFAQLHTCHDATKIVLHTDGTIKAILRRLSRAAGTSSKAELRELQTSLGWSFAPLSMMYSPLAWNVISPVLHGVYDWMHVYFVSGVFNVHVGQLIVAMKANGVDYGSLHTYVLEFEWVASVGNGC